MQRLIEELGARKVSLSPQTLRTFGEDLTEIPGNVPDLVVYAEGVEDIRRVLAYASAQKVPVVPVVSNLNVGGLAIPEKGGIVLEMRRMNRILEVNEADLYMVIEPGVTWGQVKETLDRHHPSVRYAYSLSPPDTSVLCNCLLDGLTTLSLRHGAMGEWVNGVEAVLSTGEIVRTGIGAVGPKWCANSPMPDLTGLFLNFHGTTGVVTKMSVQLWPNRKFRQRCFLPFHEAEDGIEFMRRLAREELMDDIAGISWPMVKQVFGVARPKGRDPNEPELYVFLDFSSNWSDGLEHKEELMRRVLADHSSHDDPMNVEDLVRLLPEFRPLSELPARLGFLMDHPGGGLTWVGSYGPTSAWALAYEQACRVMTAHGFPPATVLRPMRTAHFGVLRMITTFDKSNLREVERVRALNEALVDAIVPLGFFPYKTPPWVVRRLESKIDPGFRSTLRKVKQALDPHHILNPGKWMLE